MPRELQQKEVSSYESLIANSLRLMEEEGLTPQEALVESRRRMLQAQEEEPSFWKKHAITLGSLGLLSAASLAFFLAFRRKPPTSVIKDFEFLGLEGEKAAAPRRLGSILSEERKALPPAKFIDEFGNAVRVLETPDEVIPAYGKTVKEITRTFLGEINRKLARKKTVLSLEEAREAVAQVASKYGYDMGQLERYGIRSYLVNETLLRSALKTKGIKVEAGESAIADFLIASKKVIKKQLRNKNMKRAARKVLSGEGLSEGEGGKLAEMTEQALDLLKKAKEAMVGRSPFKYITSRAKKLSISEKEELTARRKKTVLESLVGEGLSEYDVKVNLKAFSDEGKKAAVRKTAAILSRVTGADKKEVESFVSGIAEEVFKKGVGN